MNQQCRAACVYFSEMRGAPAVTWMRWFEWTAAAHIKRKSSSVHFLSGSRVPYSNWIWASAFFFFFFQIILLCLCLPLTCCQLGNSQHPATLPPATSWCATVWVMSWINMLMYKGMSIGLAMRQTVYACLKGRACRERNGGVMEEQSKLHPQRSTFLFDYLRWLRRTCGKHLLCDLCRGGNPVCKMHFLKVGICFFQFL